MSIVWSVASARRAASSSMASMPTRYDRPSISPAPCHVAPAAEPSYPWAVRARWKARVLALVAVQLGDAAFNAIPTQWLRDDVEHLGIPWELRFVFPIITTTSAVGLLGGFRWPRLGRVTAAALL